jgi:hypothetical protein
MPQVGRGPGADPDAAGSASIQTTEKYLGMQQNLIEAVNDKLGIVDVKSLKSLHAETMEGCVTRLKWHHFGLAVLAPAVLCFAIRVVAAGAGSGQGRHLGQEKSHGGDGEQGRGKGHGAYQFEARQREIISGY